MENNTQLATTPQTGTAVNFFDSEQFATVQRVCTLFANSALVPEQYRALPGKTPEETAANKSQAIANCVVALDVATRIGASPLMVMQNLVIVQGRPTWGAAFLIATVNSCGRFEPIKYRWENLGKVGKVTVTEYVWDKVAREKKAMDKVYDLSNVDNWQCTAYTNRKGSNEVLEGSPINIRLAVEEGWYTKNGSKWKTMPRQMLMYRSASWWTRAYAPELSMGMHTTDEVVDFAEAEEIPINADEQLARAKAEAEQQAIVLDAPQADEQDNAEEQSGSEQNAQQSENNQGIDENAGF